MPKLKKILKDTISHEVITEPVTTLDGQTYEKEAIIGWFRTCTKHNHPMTSPATNNILSSIEYIDNHFVRAVIEHYNTALSENNNNNNNSSVASSQLELHNSNNYIDPLTGEIIVDPIIARNGITYGRAAWLRWIQAGNNFYPPSVNQPGRQSSSVPIHPGDKTEDNLIPNIIARQILANYVECSTENKNINELPLERSWQQAVAAFDVEQLIALFNQEPDFVKQKLSDGTLWSIIAAKIAAKPALLLENIDITNKLRKLFNCEALQEDIKKFLVSYQFSYNITGLHIAAAVGNMRFAAYLLEQQVNINAKDSTSNTPLHIAAAYGHTELIKLLIDNGADLNAKNKAANTPEQVGLKNDNAIIKLKEDFIARIKKNNTSAVNDFLAVNNRWLSIPLDGNGRNALHYAVLFNKIEVVIALLKHDAKLALSAKDKNGNTPLHIAATHSCQPEIAKLLINNGANVFAVNNAYETPAVIKPLQTNPVLLLREQLKALIKYGNVNELEQDFIAKNTQWLDLSLDDNDRKAIHYVDMSSQPEVVALLLKYTSNFHVKDNEGNTPLHIAIKNGKVEIAQLLIANGADLHAKDNEGNTQLHIAVKNGKVEIAQLLIANGADLHAKDIYGNTPLHRAAIVKHKELAALLIANGADFFDRNNNYNKPEGIGSRNENVIYELKNEFINCIKKGDVKAVDNCLAKNKQWLDIALDDNGMSALHYAIMFNQPHILEFLLQYATRLNRRPKYMTNISTPLHLAAQYGHKEIAELLIAKGFDMQAQDDDNCTPLHIAARYGHKEVAELLVVKRANLNAKNWEGNTPLHIAAKYGHKEIIELLINNKVNLNARNGAGKTPLYLLIDYVNNHTALANLLIDNGADPFAGNMYGVTPHKIGLDNNNNYIGSLLKDFKDSIEKGAVETIEKFLASSQQWLKIPLSDEGLGALHYAIKCNKLEVVKSIIKFDSSLVSAAIDNAGNSALHIAAAYGHAEICHWLIQNGADLKAENQAHKIPQQYEYPNTNNYLAKRCKELREAILKTASQNEAEVTSALKDIEAFIVEDKKWLQLPLDENGDTAMHYAVRAQNLTTINLIGLALSNAFHKKGKVPTFFHNANKKGMSPLHYAVFSSPELLQKYYYFSVESNRNVLKDEVIQKITHFDALYEFISMHPAALVDCLKNAKLYGLVVNLDKILLLAELNPVGMTEAYNRNIIYLESPQKEFIAVVTKLPKTFEVLWHRLSPADKLAIAKQEELFDLLLVRPELFSVIWKDLPEEYKKQQDFLAMLILKLPLTVLRSEGAENSLEVHEVLKNTIATSKESVFYKFALTITNKNSDYVKSLRKDYVETYFNEYFIKFQQKNQTLSAVHYKMGIIYHYGLFGLEKNTNKALEFFKKVTNKNLKDIIYARALVEMAIIYASLNNNEQVKILCEEIKELKLDITNDKFPEQDKLELEKLKIEASSLDSDSANQETLLVSTVAVNNSEWHKEEVIPANLENINKHLQANLNVWLKKSEKACQQNTKIAFFEIMANEVLEKMMAKARELSDNIAQLVPLNIIRGTLNDLIGMRQAPQLAKSLGKVKLADELIAYVDGYINQIEASQQAGLFTNAPVRRLEA
jgi:ankyrin repeat protein